VNAVLGMLNALRPSTRPRRTDPRARLAFALAALSLVSGLPGCASEGAGDTRRELLESWSTGLIVPLYAQFEERSQALASSVDALCSAPTDASLDAARTAWFDAREPFKRAEVFAFGPYSRPEFRIGPKIDSWPARPEEVEEWIASAEPVDPATLATLGVWHKGLPVIEYFLFSPVASGMPQLAEPRRCEYLRSTAAELVSRAREIHLAWAPEGGNFAGQLSGAGRTSTAWRTLRDAFSEVVNRMGFTLENVRRDKLGRPLGEMTGGTPDPNVAESRFSGRSLRDIQDNLAGIERLYFGDPSLSLPGLASYVSERGQNFDDRFQSGVSAARAALDAVDMPLTDAVTAEPDRVRDASTKLGELQTLIQVELISALGLSLNFNDSDGD
jgi:predicted lipoprotein